MNLHDLREAQANFVKRIDDVLEGRIENSVDRLRYVIETDKWEIEIVIERKADIISIRLENLQVNNFSFSTLSVTLKI